MSTPGAISIFLCGRRALERDHEEEDADDAGEADETPWSTVQRARLEGQRLQEQHRLEPLAVDAREPERDEPERPAPQRIPRPAPASTRFFFRWRSWRFSCQ